MAKLTHENHCACGGKLALERTDVLLGITREVYTCTDCGLPFVKDTTDPDGKLEYAVPCVMCHNLWPKSSARLIHEKNGYGHFIGQCCVEEP